MARLRSGLGEIRKAEVRVLAGEWESVMWTVKEAGLVKPEAMTPEMVPVVGFRVRPGGRAPVSEKE